MRRVALVLALLLAGAGLALAGEQPTHDAPNAHATPAGPPAAQEPQVGVREHLGAYLPEDVTLRDERGKPVNLRQLITMPTILVPVYYACPNVCNLLLGRLAEVLPQVGLKPGRDFQVIAISFDEREGPELAQRRKHDFTTTGRFPAEHWHFLTGDLPQIKRAMDAIGFHYLRQGDMFRHSVVLVAVSPMGMITRYLYGVSPLPFDIAMAASEAAKGQAGLSVTRALAFCYSYDPQGRRYVFNLMGAAGAAVLVAVVLFAFFLAAGARKRRRRLASPPGKGRP